MIIIFDLHGTIPCYSPCMEEFEQTMLGSFELRENMFRKTCGIMVGADGRIYLDLASVPDVHCDTVSSDSVAPGGAGKPAEAYQGDTTLTK